MNGTLLAELLQPHVVTFALICARLLPVVFLCPLFGGTVAPTSVRLALVLALGGFLHLAGEVRAPEELLGSTGWPGAMLRELVFGTALGLGAAAPFDAAKLGGRFIDLVRGTSAEAALPVAGTRESATGETLSRLLLALGAATFGLQHLLGALVQTFRAVSLGVKGLAAHWAQEAALMVGSTMAAGLAIGAPIAAFCLLIDGLLAIAGRLGGGASLQELSAPLRILGGAVVLWLGLGVIGARLLAELGKVAGELARMSVP